MEKDRTVSIGSWIFTMIMMSIPVVNIIYCIVLLFGGSQYKSKVNLVRASLVVILIVIALVLFLGFALFGGLKELLNAILEYLNSLL